MRRKGFGKSCREAKKYTLVRVYPVSVLSSFRLKGVGQNLFGGTSAQLPLRLLLFHMIIMISLLHSPGGMGVTAFHRNSFNYLRFIAKVYAVSFFTLVGLISRMDTTATIAAADAMMKAGNIRLISVAAMFL